MSAQHDLCEVKVNANLKVNTKVAEHAPAPYSQATVVGHPSLYPIIITKGNFSGRMLIDVRTGTRECTKEDFESENGILCLLLGGIPVVETYDAQLIAATIMPGSSGSPVFDENGEIAGLVFAGSGELSYGFIVPQEYVKAFVDEEAPKMQWKKPGKQETQKSR
jgi:hypothetical protein